MSEKVMGWELDYESQAVENSNKKLCGAGHDIPYVLNPISSYILIRKMKSVIASCGGYWSCLYKALAFCC